MALIIVISKKIYLLLTKKHIKYEIL